MLDPASYMPPRGPRRLSSYLDFPEIAVPAAPAADHLRLFARDYKGFSFPNIIDAGAGGMNRALLRDSVFVAYNDSGSLIAASRIVYASGTFGDVPTIAKAKADAAATMPAIGVTIESVANGAYGRIMQVGLLENLNTSAYAVSDVLYVSAATAGVPTATPPTYPNIRQEIGTILVDDAAVGAIQIVARSAFNDAVVDHGALIGLSDDDHTQYLLVAGTRTGSTGSAQDFGGTGIKADVIAESSDGPGVTVDGVLLQDGQVDLADDKKVLLGTGDDGEIYVNADNVHIKNATADKDIIFTTTQPGDAQLTITWDGSADKLLHSGGTFDFDNDHITTTGTVTGNNVVTSTQAIADNAILTVDDADAADNDYAKFTANGLEGRSYAEVRSDLGIGTGQGWFAYRNAALTANTGALTTFDCDTELWDSEGWFDTGTHLVTPLVAGWYYVGLMVGLQNMEGNKAMYCYIKRNALSYHEVITIVPGATAGHRMTGGGPMYFNGSSDYAEPSIYHNCVANKSMYVGGPAYNTSFFGFLVNPD
jgi:hypothetical protein